MFIPPGGNPAALSLPSQGGYHTIIRRITMIHHETMLESEIVYKGKILNLRRDTVRLENGNTALREVIEHSGGVAVVALDEADNLLMVRQFRYPTGQVLLEIPAGKLEIGEDPAECGKRELGEECGCAAGLFRPLAKLIPTCAYDTEVIHIFYAAELSAVEQHLDPDEFLTVEKIPFDEAVEMVLRGEIPDAKTQLGILKCKALRDAGRI